MEEKEGVEEAEEGLNYKPPFQNLCSNQRVQWRCRPASKLKMSQAKDKMSQNLRNKIEVFNHKQCNSLNLRV